MNMSPQVTRNDITEAFRRHLNDVPDSDIKSVEDTEKLASSMVAMVPRVTSFGKLIGPVYSTKALMKMWKVTRAAVSKKATEGKLLALKVENENLFPVFQFNGTEVRKDVLNLVHILSPAVDPFTIAQWLRTPLAGHGDTTAIDLLDNNADNVAEKAAIRAAKRWSM